MSTLHRIESFLSGPGVSMTLSREEAAEISRENKRLVENMDRASFMEQVLRSEARNLQENVDYFRARAEKAEARATEMERRATNAERGEQRLACMLEVASPLKARIAELEAQLSDADKNAREWERESDAQRIGNGRLFDLYEAEKKRIAELERDLKRTVEDRDDLFQARSELSVQLAAERAAHLETRRALVWALDTFCTAHDKYLASVHMPSVTAAREAVAKAEKEGQP